MTFSWGNCRPSILLMYGRVILTKSPLLGFAVLVCVESVCCVILAGILEKYQMSSVDMLRLVLILCKRSILFRGVQSGLGLGAGLVCVSDRLASSCCALCSCCCRDRSWSCASHFSLSSCVILQISFWRCSSMCRICFSRRVARLSGMFVQGCVWCSSYRVFAGASCRFCVLVLLVLGLVCLR